MRADTDELPAQSALSARINTSHRRGLYDCITANSSKATASTWNATCRIIHRSLLR